MNIEAQFKDKVILITGADSGLGRTFCERFVSLGARVAMAVRESALHEMVEFVRENHWEVSAFPFVVDVSRDRSADDLATEVFRRMGQIDVLINNAAVRLMKDFANITWEDWNTSVEINLRFPFFFKSNFT